MKKLAMILLLSSMVFGANTTIKALFNDIAKKVEAKQYKAVEDNIYSLSDGLNRDWIMGGINNPHKEDSIVSSFSIEAVKKLAANSDKFEYISKSKFKAPLIKTFTTRFSDDSKDKRFQKDLKKSKNVYVLVIPKVGSVVVYKDNKNFKLIWWKDMVRLANTLNQ